MLRRIRSTLRRRLPGLLIAALLPAILVPASASAAEPVFVLTGRGWGHGIGMSQWGAQGFALKSSNHEAILKHYYRGIAFGSITNPRIRVALDKYDVPKTSWQLRAYDGPLRVESSSAAKDLSKGVIYTFMPYGSKGVQVKQGSSVVATFAVGPVDAWSKISATSKGLIEAVSPTGSWDRPNIVYRGQMRVRVDSSDSSKVHLYNWLYMEEYLKGVVPRESPASWHIEALKAQAVAARSYAYRSLAPSALFDVYPTTADQVYGGYGRNVSGAIEPYEAQRTNDAVTATMNKVVKYGSEVVMTYFFSTSGGHTENIENVWGNAVPKPYYRGVEDPHEDDAGASRHIWADTWSFTASQLRQKLINGGVPVPGTIKDVVVTRRGVSGRVTQIVLKGAAGDDKTLNLKDAATGKNYVSRFKSALGLYDTWIYVTTSAVTGPSTVPYGSKTDFKVTLWPAVSDAGMKYVHTGPAAGSLTNRITVPVSAGIGYFAFAPTQATDMMVSAGSKGYGNHYVSPRFRVAVSRRLSISATRNGSRVDLRAVVTPASGAGNVVFEYQTPGATTWKILATVAVDSSGTARASHTPPGAGTWRYRVRHAGGSGFVAGTSSAVSAFILPADTKVTRFIGGDRYETSTRIGTAYGAARDGYVVLANGSAGPDALAGAALANAYGGPLMLTERDGLPSTVDAWIADPVHGVSDVFIVGGSDVVGSAVSRRLTEILGAGKVHAVYGRNRFSTAAAVARRVKAKLGAAYDGGAMVVNGWSMTDAAAASAVSAGRGWPILFVKPDSIPAPTAVALKPAAQGGEGIGTAKVWIVGGETAVGAAVQRRLEAGTKVTRAAGPDRYATALDLASRARATGATSYTRIGLVSNSGLVDALALAPFVARSQGVILLTKGTSLHVGVRTLLSANKASIEEVPIPGGAAVVRDVVIASADTALR